MRLIEIGEFWRLLNEKWRILVDLAADRWRGDRLAEFITSSSSKVSLRMALAFLDAGDASVALPRFLVDVGGVGGTAGDMTGTLTADLTVRSRPWTSETSLDEEHVSSDAGGLGVALSGLMGGG